MRIKPVYNRKDKLNSQGLAVLQLQIYLDRLQRRYLSTGIYLAPHQWNESSQQIENHAQAPLLNLKIKKLINDLTGLEISCQVEGRPLAWQEIKNLAAGQPLQYTPDAPAPTFNAYMARAIDADHRIGPETRTSQRRTLDLFNQVAPHVPFPEFTPAVIDRFDAWMHQQGFAHNTVAKHHKNLSKYIYLAIEDRGVPFSRNDYPYTKKIKRAFKRTKFDFLRPQELDRIAALELPPGTPLDHTRNRFLLACYTGLRHSDINMLSRDHLRFYDEGVAIDLTMQKVDFSIYYPCWKFFSNKAGYYLQKVGGVDYQNFRSMQDDNKYLKIIGPACDLNRPISFHISRHSFCTNLAHETNGNVLTVMQFAGIRKVETAMIYIHASRDFL